MELTIREKGHTLTEAGYGRMKVTANVIYGASV
jgi:hypothetical protein